MGQPSGAGPSFEVVSIRAASANEAAEVVRIGCQGGPGSNTPGRWNCHRVTVYALIGSAYDLKPYQISDKMAAMRLEPASFDITANVPAGTTIEQFRGMQRNLLKDRFKLALHFEKREVEGYEILVAKSGVRMKRSEPATARPEDERPPVFNGRLELDDDGYPLLPAGSRPMLAMMNGRARWGARNQSADGIAEMLATQLRRPVANATGLTDRFDITLKWSPVRAPRPGPTAEFGTAISNEVDSGPSLEQALREQLGLDLRSKRVEIDVPVIDRFDKTPTEN